MSNPTQLNWTDPTTNTDGTPLSPGEITGYVVGIRSTTAAGSVAGTYPIQAQVTGAAAVDTLISALGTVLKPDTYAGAVQTAGPTPSAWSTEGTFTIAPEQPSAPTGFGAA